jgi:uncharacterized protein (DUF169 family)
MRHVAYTPTGAYHSERDENRSIMNSTMQRKIAILHESLGLPRPPIGLAFVDQPPPGVERSDGAVPSACSFWRMAERAVFYAPEDEHLICPIGVLTMGFQVPPDRQGQAEAIIGTMCELEYITPEEAKAIPSVPKGHKGIVYGPLAQMPLDPDVCLFFCRPAQAMLLVEASNCVSWTGQGMTAFGRPTCAAIPVALQSGNASASVGCIGFRVYTEIPDDEMMIAIPDQELQGLVDRMDTITSANSTLEEFHTLRRSQL